MRLANVSWEWDFAKVPWEWDYPICHWNECIQCALGIGLSNVPWEWD